MLIDVTADENNIIQQVFFLGGCKLIPRILQPSLGVFLPLGHVCQCIIQTKDIAAGICTSIRPVR